MGQTIQPGADVNTESTDEKMPLDEKQPLAAAGKRKGVAKRPYVKPEVRHERVFETMALTCGKMQATEHGCHFNRKTS